MNKICTSIEQSKHLLELGIDINTADMMWDDWNLIDEGWKLSIGYYPEIEEDYGRKCYPAWSLNALFGLIEWDYNLEKTLFDQSDLFTYSIVCDDLDFRTYEYDDPLDAAFEMIVWLKENGKI
jgi:hypothetical protein